MTSATRENTVTEYRAGAPVRSRRRRGGLTALLAIVAVLAVILVVADRVAAQAAERELKVQLVQELQAREVGYSSLDVGVGGVPFLTQVARGRYEEITIDMTDVSLKAEGAAATLPDLHVVATGVNADAQQLVQGTATVTADQVTGTAVVSYQTLHDLIDLSQYRLQDLTFSEEDGALKASGTANLAGITLPITALADVTVVDGVIQVQLRDARAVGVEMPQVAKNYLDGLVNQNITARLPALPFGLSLDRLNVVAAGLAITATGRDVPLVR
jgi:LmeA-like phospholipid-binding